MLVILHMKCVFMTFMCTHYNHLTHDHFGHRGQPRGHDRQVTDEPRVQFAWGGGCGGGAVGARTVREHAAFMNVRLRSFALGDLCWCAVHEQCVHEPFVCVRLLGRVI